MFCKKEEDMTIMSENASIEAVADGKIRSVPGLKPDFASPRSPSCGRLRVTRALCGGFAAFCALAMADTAIWLPTDDGTHQWGTPANWQDEAGEALTVAPTNGEDIVFGSAAAETATCVRISTGVTVGNDSSAVIANGAVDPIVATVSGGSPRHEIFHAEYTSAANQPSRYFRIGQAKDFLGFWRVGNGKAYFSLESTAGEEAEMGSLIIDRRPRVAVPTDGTVGRIGETTGVGAFQKTGAGELKIGMQSSGNDAIAYVSAGTVTFAGVDEAALDEVMSRAAFRLDASAGDTLSISNADGYAWVREWRDADGKERKAQYFSRTATGNLFMNYTVPAFMSDTKSPTGLPLVSFGSGADHIGLGPSNTCMKLNSRLTNIREAFYAVETPKGAGGATILGDDTTYHYISEGSLFTDYAYSSSTCRPIREGEIRLNGSRKVLGDFTADECAAMTGCYVVSVASSTNLQFNMLANERFYMHRSGGSRIGELVVFTNVLTRAERALVNRYLMEKWTAGHDHDAKFAAVAQSAKIGVADGRTSRIRELSAPNGALVKAGGGELRTARLGPLASNCTVRVEGGSLGFDSLPDAGEEPAAPVAGPWLWLDATKEDTLGLMTSEYAPDKTLVQTWRDCRESVNRAAFCPSTNGTYNTADRVAIPSKTTYRGKTVVDFGTSNADASRMHLPDYNAGSKVYAAFMVVRNLASHFRQYFGSYTMSLYRNEGTMVASNYENAKVSSGTWTIDGEMIDPISTAWRPRYTNTEDFQVFAFSLDNPIDMNQILQDRHYGTYPNAAGRAQVGELIVYRRKLSDKERADTEAYLMRKWLGRTHPDREQNVSLRKMSFAPGVSSIIDSDIPMSVSEMTLEGDSLVKRGSGRAEIDVLSVTNHLDELNVAGGELALSLDFDFSENLLFHFDASDEGTLQTTVTSDGNGVLQTNVIKWLDVRRNGLYAESSYNAAGNKTNAHCTTNPTLQRMTMPDGVLRNAVDFGTYNDAQKAAGMLFHTTSAYGTVVAGKSSKNFTNVRELHTIYAKPATGNGSMTGPYAGNNGSNLSFYSAYWAVLSGSALDSSKNGYIATNGVSCAFNASLNRGSFYLLSLSPTADSTVGAFSIDRTTGAGGGSMSEMIAFSQPLGEVQRRFLQETLMAKWLGAPRPAWKVRSLSVGAGGKLTLTDDTPLEVGSVHGGGMVTAPGGVTGVSSLSFSYRSPEDYDTLAVDGPFALANEVSVTVTIEDPARADVGVYPLVSASGSPAAGVERWNFACQGLPQRLRAKLDLSGGGVALRLWTVGTSVILK